MKKRILILLLFLYPLIGTCQEKLNKLQTPTSPASSILGIQPLTVLAPKSFQALETAIYSNFYSNGSPNIPNDFALEFTPYWTKDHALSLDEYLFPTIPFARFIRQSSFSIASTQNFQLDNNVTSNGLALGYRTSFYLSNQNDKEKIKNLDSNLEKNQLVVSNIVSKAQEIAISVNVKTSDDFLQLIKMPIRTMIQQDGSTELIARSDEIINNLHSDIKSFPVYNEKNPYPFLNEFNTWLREQLKSKFHFEEFKNYIKEREGFLIDIAYASLLNFPTNNFNLSYVPRQSIWLTPTYRFNTHGITINAMGVLRYEWYNLDYYKKYFINSQVYQNNLDFGLAISSKFERFSFQLEIVGRSSNTEINVGTDGEGNILYRRDGRSDLQYIGSFNYNLSDQIVLSYNLGNRFEPILNPTNTLVSNLSLNFGFGAPTKNDIVSKKME